MTRIVQKFEIKGEPTIFELPAGSIIRHVQGSIIRHVGSEGTGIYMWIEIDIDTQEKEVFTLLSIKSNEELPNTKIEYVGTVFNEFEWHLYKTETTEALPPALKPEPEVEPIETLQ